MTTNTIDIEIAPEYSVVSQKPKPDASFIPIASQNPVTLRQTYGTLLYGVVFIILLVGYHAFLLCHFGGERLYFIPAFSAVALPLLMLLPICGSLFQTEIGIHLLALGLPMILVGFGLAKLNGSVYNPYDNSSNWILCFVNAGLLEEILKGLMYMVPLWMGRIKYGYQLVYFAAISGLLFGVTENVVYAVNYSSRTQEVIPGASVADLIMGYRLLYTPLLHMYLTVLGSCIVLLTITGLKSFGRLWVVCVIAILVPAVIHGSYNAFLLTDDAKLPYISSILFLITVQTVHSLLVYVRSRQFAETVSSK